MRSVKWGLWGAVICGGMVAIAGITGTSGPQNHLVDNPFGAAFAGYALGWAVSEVNYWFDRRNGVH